LQNLYRGTTSIQQFSSKETSALDNPIILEINDGFANDGFYCVKVISDSSRGFVRRGVIKVLVWS
jgi:hypothetical protein